MKSIHAVFTLTLFRSFGVACFRCLFFSHYYHYLVRNKFYQLMDNLHQQRHQVSNISYCSALHSNINFWWLQAQDLENLSRSRWKGWGWMRFLHIPRDFIQFCFSSFHWKILYNEFIKIKSYLFLYLLLPLMSHSYKYVISA